MLVIVRIIIATTAIIVLIITIIVTVIVIVVIIIITNIDYNTCLAPTNIGTCTTTNITYVFVVINIDVL